MGKSLKVLVTGGAGFIGSHLVDRLVSEGCIVRVLDDLSSGKLANIAGHLSAGRLEFVQGDIRDTALVGKCLSDVDAVVHLAALIDVAGSVVDPDLTYDVNVTGTFRLLKEAKRCKVRKFVLASSTAVYGDVKVLPVKEDAVLSPISPYAASKAAGEAFCTAFTNCYGLNTVRLRFFNVYGPRSEKTFYSGVITKFLNQALKGEDLVIYGDGEQTRDFIYVSDIVEALFLALKTEEMGEVFNVCTGVPTTVNELARTLRTVTKRDLHVRHSERRTGDILFSYGDPHKAKRKLGFTAKTSLKKGLGFLLKSAR
jgi:UDP-glucose 4-epimerase